MTVNPTNRTRGDGTDGALGRRTQRFVPLASAISAILAGVPAAHAQQRGEGAVLEEVVVTAQKRSENLQDVPVSIQALGTEKLEELHIGRLDDYVKYLPNVSMIRSQGQGGNGQPGTTHVYMRGVASGGNENHSGSQPSVGTYLDEQPVTTIDGTLDVHVYDIARVEVLAGPQGTLYGASSQAGTIRIITNKPDPSRFAAGYDVGVNTVSNGGTGYSAEGFVNIPLSANAAVRLVGWDVRDAGFIDNVAGTNVNACIQNGVRTFPTWNGQAYGPLPHPPFNVCATTPGPVGAGAISNAGFVKNDYNKVHTSGGRGALKLNLGDNWTITPTFMGQKTSSDGFFGYDPTVGELKITHFSPEYATDSFTQAALTVEGKIANLDVVYAGSFMKRTTQSRADYSDYSLFYDKVWGSGYYATDNAGNFIMPQQQVLGHDHFSKWSNELRMSTPANLPVKATVGVFAQRQVHDIEQRYYMPGYNGAGLSDALSVPGWPNTVWLTDQQRVDRDTAAFGQVTWDITDQWALTGGVRFFKAKNSLEGYYGYSANYQSLTNYGSGMMRCGPNGATNAGTQDPPASTDGKWVVTDPTLFSYKPFHGAPCTNLSAGTDESGHTPRVNLTYKVAPDKMVYVTYSKGFRPGGANRNIDPNTRAPFLPYKADFLTNYEFGWKTKWLGNRLRWNGAVFQEDWKDFQFSFLGPSSLTIINNGGQAKIKGLETDLEWAASANLTLAASATYLFTHELTSNYCGAVGADGKAVTSCDGVVTEKIRDGGIDGPLWIGPLAPAGTKLPVSPSFKGNVVARYTFEAMGWNANVQATGVYQGSSYSVLRLIDQHRLGENRAYGLLDLSAGIEKNGMSVQLVVGNVLDKRGDLTRFAQCAPKYCNQPYVIPTQPRTIGLKFGQKFGGG